MVLICIKLGVNEIEHLFVSLLALCFSVSLSWLLRKQGLLGCAAQIALRDGAPIPSAGAQAVGEGTQLSVSLLGLLQLKRARYPKVLLPSQEYPYATISQYETVKAHLLCYQFGSPSPRAAH